MLSSFLVPASHLFSFNLYLDLAILADLDQLNKPSYKYVLISYLMACPPEGKLEVRLSWWT